MTASVRGAFVCGRVYAVFLLGSRAAILDATAYLPACLLIGVLLVLSAGFVRANDDEVLCTIPWWLLSPYAASLATSLLLVGLYRLIAKAKAHFMWFYNPFSAPTG